MKRYSLTHLSNPVLRRGLDAMAAQDRVTTSALLAYLAEFDARKLYRPAACSSMFAYCVSRLGLSEDSAAKRIQAARLARRFPVIFGALADGRLHLSGVVLLAPHLTEDTAPDLLAAAAHKTKAEIERLLAERFPQPEVLAWVAAVPAKQHAPGHVGMTTPERAPGRVAAPAPRAAVAPLAAGRFALQFSVGESTLDDLAPA